MRTTKQYRRRRAAAVSALAAATAAAGAVALSAGNAFAQTSGDAQRAAARERMAQERRTQAAVRDAMRVGAPGTAQRGGAAPMPGSPFSHQTPREMFPSFVTGQGGAGGSFYFSSGPAFPPISAGNVYSSPSSLPPIQGPGYYTLPDGSAVRPAGSSGWGGGYGYGRDGGGSARGREGARQNGSYGGGYNGDPLGAIPFGNGTLTPYPTDPRAPAHPDAPYTRGPIEGTYQGKGSLSNVLIFPGYRSTFVVNQTVVAPFGSWYGCPGYIDARYVVATPWPYAGGVAVAPVSAWSDADPFLTADAVRARELRTALNDLTRFWEGGDIRGLRRHLPGGAENVAVFHNGKYLYALGRNDFATVSTDVIESVDTVSFRFTRVERRDDGLIDATARHRYRVRETGETREGTVRYSLLYQDGTYFISAVSITSGG